MDRHTALEILGLDTNATPDQLQSALRRGLAEINQEIDSATTGAVRAERRAARDRLTQAAYSVLYEMATSAPPANARPLQRAPDISVQDNPGHRSTDNLAVIAEATQPTLPRMHRNKLWAVALATIVLAGTGATFPAWRGPARSMFRGALHYPEVQAADESVRINALPSATKHNQLAADPSTVATEFADALTRTAHGDDELSAGRVSQAVESSDSAGRLLDDVRVQALADLLSTARGHEAAGKMTAAILALDELLTLDPDNAAGAQLRRRVLSHRITNSIGMELVFIPPGEFLMGSPTDELGRDQDERQHAAKLDTGFYMGATEVTQLQWRTVMGNDPAKWKGDELPVEQILWTEAVEYCRRLSEKEMRRYRLPTEVEWEYACRAGTGTPFAFGETISTEQVNHDGDFAYGNGTKGISRRRTVPVRSFPAGPWGLYDIHGNVWEWCADTFDAITPNPIVKMPKNDAVEAHALRGGSWRSRPRFCRAANRVLDDTGSRLSNVGFRVLLESD